MRVKGFIIARMKYSEMLKAWAARRAKIRGWATGKSLAQVAAHFNMSKARAQQIIGKRT